MNYVSLLIILVGIYLVDSGIKNRAPIGFLIALLSSDKPDLKKTLAEFDGKWQQGFSTIAPAGSTTPASGGAGLGSSNDPRNGKLNNSELTKLSWNSKRVANAAAPSLEELNRAYREAFRANIVVTDGYRSYAEQVAVKAAKPHLAAPPGTSNHGMGLAVDLGGGIQNFGSAQHTWMMANAGKYGWVQPSWAQQNGSKPEAWHWEFVGGKGVSA